MKKEVCLKIEIQGPERIMYNGIVLFNRTWRGYDFPDKQRVVSDNWEVRNAEANAISHTDSTMLFNRNMN